MSMSLNYIARELRRTFADVEASIEPGAKTSQIRFAKADDVGGDEVLFVLSSDFDEHSLPKTAAGYIVAGPVHPPKDSSYIWAKNETDPFNLLNAAMDAIERYADWADDARSQLLACAPSAEVAKTLGTMTRNPFVYLDNSLHVLYMSESDYLENSSEIWRGLKADHGFSAEVLSSLIASGDLDRVGSRTSAWALFDSKTFSLPLGVKTLEHEGSIHGYLATVGCVEDPSLEDVEVLEELGNLIARYAGSKQARATESSHITDKIIRECLVKEPFDRAGAAYLASMLDWSVDDEYRIRVFSPRGAQTVEPERLPAHLVERDLGGRALEFESGIVHLLNLTRSRKREPSGAEVAALCESLDMQAGESGVFSDLADIASAYRQAKSALREGRRHDGERRLYRFDDYRVDSLCSILARSIGEKLLISRDVEALAAYDAEERTNLLQTLEAYLRNNRSVRKTADALYLHRNSVAYRMEKVRAIARADTDNPDVRLHLLLSLKIWRREHPHG